MIVKVVGCPAVTVSKDGALKSEKSSPPMRATLCVVGVALSVTVKMAVRVPAAEGVNTTLIVQVPSACTVVPQLLVWEKSLWFPPVIETMVIVSGPLPLFTSVTA